jgi:1-aminocyclopropane-1-carboxylate synthase 1/2/6
MKDLMGEPSAIVEGHLLCASDPYSTGNPRGYLNLGIAENHLMSDILVPYFQNHFPLEKEDFQYFDLSGLPSVKQATSKFLTKYLFIKDMNPENLILFNGLSSACECLSYSMFDEGDLMMIPTPYYTGFEYDFQKRFGVDFLKVKLKPENRFQHKVSDFVEAYESCENKDKVKAILITHPHNPTGEVLEEEFLRDIVKFAKDNRLEILSDEIYALTRMDQGNHRSIYEFAGDYREHIHFMYGLAKDFTLAGLKVGIFYTENPQLKEAMSSLTYFHCTNALTQRFLEQFLSDYVFLDEFIKLNQVRLKEVKNHLTQSLPDMKIIDGDSGLFFLLDLREYLPEQSFDAETKLFQKLLNEHKIFLTAGQDLGMEVPGYFRLCFAKAPEIIDEFILRFKGL